MRHAERPLGTGKLVCLQGVPKTDCRMDPETIELLKGMENSIRASNKSLR